MCGGFRPVWAKLCVLQQQWKLQLLLPEWISGE